MIDDVAVVGIRVDEYGHQAVTLYVFSNSASIPIALGRALTEEQVKQVQVALGQKLRALRNA